MSDNNKSLLRGIQGVAVANILWSVGELTYSHFKQKKTEAKEQKKAKARACNLCKQISLSSAFLLWTYEKN